MEQEFKTFDEAFNFYKIYAKMCGFPSRCGTKYHQKDGNIMLNYFVCHRNGWNTNI